MGHGQHPRVAGARRAEGRVGRPAGEPLGDLLQVAAELRELLRGRPERAARHGRRLQPFVGLGRHRRDERPRPLRVELEPGQRDLLQGAQRRGLRGIRPHVPRRRGQPPRLLAAACGRPLDEAVLLEGAEMEGAARWRLPHARRAFGCRELMVVEQVEQPHPEWVRERPKARRIGDALQRLLRHAVSVRCERYLAQEFFHRPSHRRLRADVSGVFAPCNTANGRRKRTREMLKPTHSDASPIWRPRCPTSSPLNL
ncbi:hypothetical protein MIPYR_10167 [uncultured Microbacterium sp.]|uniref:Uncharacterized protein n=1 Tax=uncultured Microbacterium sp. TaxID=191216 RepID=A0A1Y5NUC5_9MICO|nr:hypothetical protein MIPYR_10167 [uncultured Microbacterium sp.]